MKSIAITALVALTVSTVSAEEVAFTCSNPPLCEDNPHSNLADSVAENHTLFDSLDAWAAETRGNGSRWARLEYQFDSRGFNVVHAMGNSPLPGGFHIFTFIDLEGADLSGANREDLSTYFLEIDLRKELFFNSGPIAEHNDFQGDGNAIGRLGYFYQPDANWLQPAEGLFAGNAFLFFKFFPYSLNQGGWQASVAYNKNFDNFLDGRFSMGGFFDMNWDTGHAERDVIVSEHQVRLRVVEGLHLMVEFRLNQFLNDEFGVAPSIQYRF